MIYQRVLITLILILSLLLMFSCDRKQPDTALEDKKSGKHGLVIELSGQNGKSVLEITRQNHTVDTEESSLGIFVKAIDSVYSGDGYWWVYTVNDSTAHIACDKYITNDSDRIKWIYSKP